jgi:hypothetical protein
VTALRYFESAAEGGFRFVGFANDIARLRGARGARIDHEGWYSDSFQEATYRPCVLQVTGKGRAARYVAAYQESDNDGFLVDLSEVFSEGADQQCGCDPRDSDGALEAARAADRFAEREAEKSREYDEAWQAGAQWARLREDEHANRAQLLTLAREARALRVKVSPDEAPTVCAQLRAIVLNLAVEIQASRDKRAEISDFGAYAIHQGLHLAFNDGAGETVIA